MTLLFKLLYKINKLWGYDRAVVMRHYDHAWHYTELGYDKQSMIRHTRVIGNLPFGRNIFSIEIFDRSFSLGYILILTWIFSIIVLAPTACALSILKNFQHVL